MRGDMILPRGLTAEDIISLGAEMLPAPAAADAEAGAGGKSPSQSQQQEEEGLDQFSLYRLAHFLARKVCGA